MPPDQIAVPYEAVLAHLRARVAEDAVTIAVLQARLDAVAAGPVDPPAPEESPQVP